MSCALVGRQLAKHVPAPAGTALSRRCLLPELHTRGPSFAGLPEKELRLEAIAARSWPAFLRARADPSVLRADMEHCLRLHAAGSMPDLTGAAAGDDPRLATARHCSVAGPAAAALDPCRLPSRILLQHAAPSPEKDGPPAAAAATAAAAGGGLEALEWPPAVYVAARWRCSLLTEIAFSVLEMYRCVGTRKPRKTPRPAIHIRRAPIAPIAERC